MSRSTAARPSLVALFLLCLATLTQPPPVVVAQGAPATEPTCERGFTETTAVARASLEGVVAVDGEAWAVGFRLRRHGGGSRAPIAWRSSPEGWLEVTVPSAGSDEGLMGVAASVPSRPWAVGFLTPLGALRPLALVYARGRWRRESPPYDGRYQATLTDIALDRHGRPWVVGFRTRADGSRRPFVRRRDGGSWRAVDPSPVGVVSMTLTAVAADARGLWAVGHAGSGSRAHPIALRRERHRWRPVRLPRFAGDAVLTDVDTTSRGDAWAVGYRLRADRSTPLVLRWDGAGWAEAAGPGAGWAEAAGPGAGWAEAAGPGAAWAEAAGPGAAWEHVVLTGVSIAEGGQVWVTGARWDATRRSFVSLAARWDGTGWVEQDGPDGGSELHDVSGEPLPGGPGWLVGRARRAGVATRACLDGTTGGQAHLGPAAPISADPATAAAVGRTDANPQAASGRVVRGAVRRRMHGRSWRPRLRPLPAPRQDPRFVVRDVAAIAGLGRTSPTYGGVVADFDGDGQKDVFIGLHFPTGRLLLGRQGAFVDSPPFAMPKADRHGCAAADVDGSGLPDLFCAVGASRGSSLKANELWLDPGGPAPRERALESGVSDVTGRGRLAVFISRGDGSPDDLVMANAGVRVDGLPSPNRHLRQDDEGRFRTIRSGIAPESGAVALERADIDHDGWDELLHVASDGIRDGSSGLRVYRGTKDGLVDVTRRWGVRPMEDRDAIAPDMDGDGHLDLVQVSDGRLRVSLWRRGRFHPAYERSLSHGEALASGDTDGDGRPDLYILRRAFGRNPSDILLLSRRGGRRYRAVTIPQTHLGDADEVLALDHDGNGLSDFLVLNGRREPGPVQLLAAFPRSAQPVQRAIDGR